MFENLVFLFKNLIFLSIKNEIFKLRINYDQNINFIIKFLILYKFVLRITIFTFFLYLLCEKGEKSFEQTNKLFFFTIVPPPVRYCSNKSFFCSTHKATKSFISNKLPFLNSFDHSPSNLMLYSLYLLGLKL